MVHIGIAVIAPRDISQIVDDFWALGNVLKMKNVRAIFEKILPVPRVKEDRTHKIMEVICWLVVKRSSGNSSCCNFFNSTLEILTSTCGDGSATLSLEDATRSFNSLLKSTSLWEVRDKQEVGWAVTVLLQSVELAALAAALRSPERTTQNVTTESLAIQTRLVTGDCSRDSEVFTLRAHNDTMGVHCDTVTGAATHDSLTTPSSWTPSWTLDSIISARHLSEGNLPAGGKPEKSHLNSRVVSGAVGDGRPINLSRPANLTLRHKQDKKREEEALCVYWKVVAESGSWSPDGCTAVHTNSTHTTCRCDHLSSFAVLMAPTTVTESYPLTVVTYMGLTFSMLCLLLAILTFLLCRSIRNVSTSLHLQLCLCLFLADLLFLIALTRTGSWVQPDSSTRCRAGGCHTTASMEPAQITAAVMSIVNTSPIIMQYMQNQNLQKQARR
ncbi:unnamed protein product [Caretta caretta]